MPGKPITASQLGERLRALGIYAMPGRRAALTDLAAKMPAAVFADLLHLSPGTTVRWVHQAGGDWSPLRRRTRPGTRSPDLTNASAAETGPAPLDMIGTAPVTSSDANVPVQLIMAKTRHKNLRTAMRYIKLGGEAVAEITGILGPSRRKH